jgi:hypothetical protein
VLSSTNLIENLFGRVREIGRRVKRWQNGTMVQLQPGISSGDPRHIDTAVRVLAHKAKLNGYAVDPEQAGIASSFQIKINLGDTDEDDD